MTGIRLTRRNFLKSVGVAGALAVAGDGLFYSTETFAEEPREIAKLYPTICGMCENGCGVLAYVRGGRLHKIEGNYRHSHSLGKICARGAAGVKLLYDPQRLRMPMKRVGEGEFEKIMWEQAFEEIGQKLQELKARHGPQTLAWMRHPDLSDAYDVQFMKAFGSPNIFSHISLGRAARNVACELTLGTVPFSDYANTKYAFILGRNLAESIFVSDTYGLMQAKSEGAKVVIVDPRLSNTAAIADEWLPIRPGTDGALLLGMMNVIVSERLYDAEFVNKHTVGFKELEEFLVDKTPWWAASVTDVLEETIIRLARELADARPRCLVDPGWHGGWGGMYANSVQTARAALILNALLGNYGARGGLLLPPKRPIGSFAMPPTPEITAERVDGAGGAQYPFALRAEGIVQRLPDIVLTESPYPITALVVNHMNPAMSLPNTDKVIRALQKLELLVVIDVQGSETAELAHYILPESTYLERHDPPAVSKRAIPEVALRQPVVETLHDTRPAHEIITGLARAAGLGSYFDFDFEKMCQADLDPLGIDLKEFEPSAVWRGREEIEYGDVAFPTEDGKIHIQLSEFEGTEYDRLPDYSPPAVAPEANAFRLLTGHDAAHTGTATQNNPWLASLTEENELWINADQAARLGISDGDWVLVRSGIAEVRVKAKVTEGIHPSAVWLAHGFGHYAEMMRNARGKGANDSVLITDMVDPISGAAMLAEVIVTVERTD